MTLAESVSYFHSLLRFGIKPGLERIRSLMDFLGNPQDELQFIHIAGTNGKGSTAIMLSNIFQDAGYQTGLYISPYITDFRERIQINNRMIDETVFCRCAQQVKKAVAIIEKKGDVITEFEAVTAAAFLCFKEKNCDIVILETGLGGRFDATNIIQNPIASVITSISSDHTAVLGDTLAKIAYEKGGIIKEGRPTIVPDSLPCEAMQVIQQIAREKHSPISVIPVKKIPITNEALTGFDMALSNGSRLHISIPGEKQKDNALLAISAAKCAALQTGMHISSDNICNGLAKAKNPARIELLHANPTVLLDGSHNDAATRMLADFLQKQLPNKKLLAVLGMMADKDIDTVLDNLLPCFEKVIATTPSNPRAIRASELADRVNKKSTVAVAINSPADAVKAAFSDLTDFDALVVCGSLYLAGDVRNILINTVDEIY